MTDTESTSWQDPPPGEPMSYDESMVRQSNATDDQLSVFYLDGHNYIYPPPYSTQPPPPYEGHTAPRSQNTRPKFFNQPPTVHQPVPVRDSYTGHLITSCMVTLLCGGLLGIVAFILATVAARKASNGDQLGARNLGNVSYSLSVIGIMVGVVLWIVIIVMLVATDSGSSTCTWYECGQACWRHAQLGPCVGHSEHSAYCQDDDHCYYN